MRRSVLPIAVALVMWATPARSFSEQTPKPTADQVRQLIDAAATDAGANAEAFKRTVQQMLGRSLPEFQSEFLVLAPNDEMLIAAAGPIQTLILERAERMGRMNPLVSNAPADCVAIIIKPLRITNIDIVKLTVTRDRVPVQSVSGQLTVIDQTTPTGAKRPVHSGVVYYPTAAFKPGAAVAVTAMTASGDQLMHPVSEAKLRRIQ